MAGTSDGEGRRTRGRRLLLRCALGCATVTAVGLVGSALAGFWFADLVDDFREDSANECPHRLPFSPPFPAHGDPETTVQRRACGGSALADVAVEKAYVEYHTGDGLGGLNGRALEVWLLRRTGSGWRRELLMEHEFNSCSVCVEIQYGSFDIARDGPRVAVVARRRSAPVWGWVVYSKGGNSRVVEKVPEGSARELLRDSPVVPP